MSTSAYHNENQFGLETAIKEVYNDICKAFAGIDIESALSSFSDREEMAKISNGVLFVGKEQLAENWHQRLGNESALRIRLENIAIHKIDDKHAWATADEYISIGDQDHKAIVSNVFVLEDSGWKILLDHTTYVPPDIKESE